MWDALGKETWSASLTSEFLCRVVCLEIYNYCGAPLASSTACAHPWFPSHNVGVMVYFWQGTFCATACSLTPALTAPTHCDNGMRLLCRYRLLKPVLIVLTDCGNACFLCRYSLYSLCLCACCAFVGMGPSSTWRSRIRDIILVIIFNHSMGSSSLCSLCSCACCAFAGTGPSSAWRSRSRLPLWR